MMEAKWISLDIVSHVLAMNVPGGVVLSGDPSGGESSMVFIPLVQVVEENDKVGFVSIMAETSLMAAQSGMAAVGALMQSLDRG